MDNDANSKSKLIAELDQCRQRVAELEVAEAKTAQAFQEHLEEITQYNTKLIVLNAHLLTIIEQQRNQLRALGTKLVETEEAERRHLARELHDQVGQSLTAMGLNLDIIRALLPTDTPDEVMSHLDDTRTLVTRTTKRVRQVMVDLRPEILDDYGLLAALHWSAERFSKRTDIAVVVEGEEADHRLPAHVENVLYRVAQEALTNIAKYAQATQVSISLKLDSKTVHLTVTDNGIGFTLKNRPASDQEQQWGLTIMAERVEGINGRLRLETQPGKGTSIKVEVPR